MNEGSALAAPSATPAPATTTEGSASPAASPAQPNSTTDAPLDMAKIFGEDFAKDPSMAKFKTPADVAKSYKELQAMASKPRFDVPTAETPPEVAAEFYKKMGVPETPDAYGLKPDAFRPEGNNETNAEFLKAFSSIAHEAKLTPAQAQTVHKFMDDLTVNVEKAQQEAQAAEDAKLDEMFTKALGDEKTTAATRIEQLINQVIPEDMKAALAGKMSNEALTAIAIIEKHLRTTYGQSDSNINDPSNNAGKSLDDLRKEASDLMNSPSYQNVMDPGHKATKEKVNAMYKTIGELTAFSKKK